MIGSKTLLQSSILWNVVFVLTLLVYAVGISVNIMEPDAAVYASVSMTMHDTGNFIDIVYKGNDWLDKPHFQFWITAFFYKIFGVNNFGYKFPAILFSLVGVLYTYLFGKHFYSKKVGFIAAMMLMTCEHILLSNQDVRAEPYLTGMTIFSLYYFALYLQSKSWGHMLAGALGLGILLMTKGLFTIIPIGAAVLFSLLYQRRWKEIFHWQWIAAGLLVLVFTAPTLYSYYQQFDMHPEKVIFGRQGVSGIKFFFWDSQWGRFTNTGPIRGEGDPTFFFHTLLWAFAPWALPAYFALFVKTKGLIRKTTKSEHYTYFGFMAMLLIFSASKFQLPHYINAILPLLAVITAHVVVKHAKNLRVLKTLNVLQVITIVLLGAVVVFIQYTFMSQAPHWVTFVLWAIVLLLLYNIYFRQKTIMKKVLFAPALFVLACQFYLNMDFYPILLRYQSESELVKYIKKNDIDVERLITLEKFQILTEFYLHHIIPDYSLENVDASDLRNKYIYTNEEGLAKLRDHHLDPVILHTFEDYHITTITPKFFDKKTRSEAVDHMYLLTL